MYYNKNITIQRTIKRPDYTDIKEFGEKDSDFWTIYCNEKYFKGLMYCEIIIKWMYV